MLFLAVRASGELRSRGILMSTKRLGKIHAAQSDTLALDICCLQVDIASVFQRMAKAGMWLKRNRRSVRRQKLGDPPAQCAVCSFLLIHDW